MQAIVFNNYKFLFIQNTIWLLYSFIKYLYKRYIIILEPGIHIYMHLNIIFILCVILLVKRHNATLKGIRSRQAGKSTEAPR